MYCINLKTQASLRHARILLEATTAALPGDAQRRNVTKEKVGGGSKLVVSAMFPCWLVLPAPFSFPKANMGRGNIGIVGTMVGDLGTTARRYLRAWERKLLKYRE